ncbi:DUF3347 domain-containing protein [Exilibacterium tricleocarpae]|uniref:DUF3347 domain-containing protein n=1 Tax=Exilibacterium tricleocarpae TaxID=2591008 RepID=A0A545T8G5_9GAMM|nr:efflux RND transporter periplasmic adaptor subunit [Exilibacterium tricleocarpae]TQV73506.1 DUF3347 domain-containing protein [Exilibacterium tricleocarpae]
MKRSKQKLYIISVLLVLVVTFSIGRCTAPDSSQTQQTSVNQSGTGDSQSHVGHQQQTNFLPEEFTTWTCSMHPQIQQPEPGQCPICGMELIPITASSGEDSGPRTLTMSQTAEALADIQTTRVEKRYPEAKVRLVGKLGYDETRVRSLSARFPARIDRLFVNFNGLKVQRGEHLAQVYSPELLTAVSELLTSHRYNPGSSATKSAKEKLRLWDLLPSQIEKILEDNNPIEEFELLAPISGVVVQKKINEGDYVKTGQPLFKIVDLSHLWLQLEAYEADLAWLRFGQSVSFSVEAFPGESFGGNISFIEPELNRKTRTVTLRVNVPNNGGRLKPGMFAKAQISAQIAKNGIVYTPELIGKWISPMHPQIIKDGPGQCDICGMDLVPVEKMGITVDEEAEAPLVLPASAVLRTGKRAVVYLKKNAERPTFEGREINLGARAGDFYIVKSGLEQGDEVVTHGAFKIDSALQIQAKPSMMNPDGGGPIPGHQHQESSTNSIDHEHSDYDSGGHVGLSLKIDLITSKNLLPHYLSLQSGLAEDDIESAKNTLKEMMKVTGHSGQLSSLVHTMLAAESLDDLRKPGFEALSKAMIDQVSRRPEAFGQTVYQMFCPMVYGDRGTSWLQADNNLRNPYFGGRMLQCGELETVHKVGEASIHAH